MQFRSGHGDFEIGSYYSNTEHAEDSDYTASGVVYWNSDKTKLSYKSNQFISLGVKNGKLTWSNAAKENTLFFDHTRIGLQLRLLKNLFTARKPLTV